MKFKVGERVRCIKSYNDEFTIGKIYTVIDNSDYDFPCFTSIEKDDKGEPNGWDENNFESAEKELFYIDLLKE